MAKILLVEDDQLAAAGVRDRLSAEGHLLETAETGEDALQMLTAFEFDIIILDWSLPGITGIQVCREYRKRGGASWIIFCTAMSEIDQKEQGLEAGADDYLVKPYNLRELVARIKSALRRGGTPFQAEISIENVVLDTEKKTVRVNGEILKLMPKEYAVLEYLMKNAGKKIPPKKVLAAVWSSEKAVSEGTVRTFMLSLRNKLDKAGKPDFIKTVPGFGYVIDSNEA